ncbi:hypothetical protein HK103_002129 [Boothiomyces macroporosus]|uniref:Uncharacterized protein n=1 Tax=Boothiomyces macroporosus TaxID=261099 RepID=A0AAD5UJ95_9FUNG|nr:hypothetical protein HK103_002129 [Boothiomyces macroporosus]
MALGGAINNVVQKSTFLSKSSEGYIRRANTARMSQAAAVISDLNEESQFTFSIGILNCYFESEGALANCFPKIYHTNDKSYFEPLTQIFREQYIEFTLYLSFIVEVVTKRRNRLSPEIVTKLVQLYMNSKIVDKENNLVNIMMGWNMM